MMRRFFKKLTFVMALSMVVSSASPAARIVSAADDRTLSIAYQNGAVITELNLTKDWSSEDLKAVGAPSNWKELKMYWMSADESIATVDNAGVVTAVSSGTTEIFVTCGDYIGSITVNCFDAAKKYTVTMGTADERSITDKTLKVGETFDLNFYGIKDYGRDKVNNAPRYFCEWDSIDPSIATVDNNTGIVTAVAPGKTKITLLIWNIATGTKHEVTPCLVTVEADATPTPTPTLVRNQLNATQNTIYVNADKNANLNINNVEFYHVFKADNDKNGDGIIDEKNAENPYENFYVKSVSYNEEKAAWEIKTFDDFTDGEWYEVVVNGREERFKASVGDVARVEVEVLQNAKLETANAELIPAKVSVKLYDANDVDVTDREIDGIANNDVSNITFSFVEENTAYSFVDYDEIEFYEDAVALVYATYTCGDVEKDSIPVSIKPSEYATYGIDEIITWTLVAPGKKADWSNPVHTMPAGESDWEIATLFKDTYGDYYTTHEISASVGDNAEGAKYLGKPVYFTEDSERSFYKSGLYVEYKAMNPDKMLIENYGKVVSYEKGTARYAMYLYNYNQYNGEFVAPVYSQSITVCHPTEMTNMEVVSNNVSLMWETDDDPATYRATTEEKNAYYSLFSTTKVVIAPKDRLHNTLASTDQAKDAEFEIELLTKSTKSDEYYDQLEKLVNKEFVDRIGYGYNADGKKVADGEYYAFEIGAKDFYAKDASGNVIYANGKPVSILGTRTQIKFKITETTTKTSTTVTLNVNPVVKTTFVDTNGNKVETKVALVKELDDALGVTVYFEKFILSDSSFTVKQYISDAKKDEVYNNDNKYEVTLSQVDQKNRPIGYDSNLYISDSINPNIGNIYRIDASGNLALVSSADLKKGDRVMSVKDPSGKAYSVVGNGVSNSVYTKSEENLLVKYGLSSAIPASSSAAMGITITTATKAITATSEAGNPVDISAYQFSFRAADSTGELAYAKNGKYTATIQTVESFSYSKVNNPTADMLINLYEYNSTNKTYFKTADASVDKNKTYYKENVIFASGAGLKSTVTFTVENNNPEVTKISRDNYRIAASLPYTKTESGADDNSIICEAIIDAFTFKLGDSEWTEGAGAGKLSADDILYYTYRVTPSNNQIQINTVTFKVPVMNDGKETGEWYRSTATVNQSLTFEY